VTVAGFHGIYFGYREMKQVSLGRSCGSRLAQILCVLARELPRMVGIIAKMEGLDFVAFVQRQPKLVFLE